MSRLRLQKYLKITGETPVKDGKAGQEAIQAIRALHLKGWDNFILPDYPRNFTNDQMKLKMVESCVGCFMTPYITSQQTIDDFEMELSLNIHIKSWPNYPGSVVISLRNQYLQPQQLGELIIKTIKMKRNEDQDAKVCIEVFAGESNAPELDHWKDWNELSTATGWSPRVSLALVLTKDLPSDDVLRLWIGDGPISMLVISNSCFSRFGNSPVFLPPTHELWIKRFLQCHECALTVETPSLHSSDSDEYLECLKNSFSDFVKSIPNTGEEDLLSHPLQPLYDDLTTHIYEDFERDPIKYKNYQNSIASALSDMMPEEEAETAETKTLTLMIVGAGRGPFIRSAVNASKNTDRPVKIVVVEKNLNAFLTLDDLVQTMWPELGIEVIHEDMRRLKYTGKADILVSELLGSFGDNELSPECLDGAQQSLKPGTGISIPFKSISYIRPVMSTMMHHQLSSRMYEIFKKPREMNWVSFLSRVFYIDDAKEVFTFVHPNHDEPIDNTRHAKLEFTANVDCQLDGFCGYFTAKLYKDIEISINPKTYSKGLISWYPIIFPSLHRVYIQKGETLTIEIWRRVNDTKVWYEWKINEGIIANINGESSPIWL